MSSRSFDWESALNDDDGLYFYPIGHRVDGHFKIHFELSGSYSLNVSDAFFSEKSVLFFEYSDIDDDQPAQIGFIEADVTIESMIEYLKNIDPAYHESIYKSIHEWALKLFYR
ncbi:hypothetical protein ACSIA8_000691 [Serratia marcescens]